MGKGRISPQRLALVVALLLSLGSGIAPRAHAAAADSAPAVVSFRVYATQEGLVGDSTSTGHIIQPNDHFVALPCVCVLSSKGGHEFQVRVDYKGKSVTAPVWDVGPWNIDDDYWNPPAQRKYTGLPQGVPEATAAYFNGYNGGRDGKGRAVRIPAGIDLADGTFADLGMSDSDWVTVSFLWLPSVSLNALPALPAGYQDIPTVAFGQRPPLDPVKPKDPAKYTYFPETQHNVAAPLMAYWNANGGWRNLGLPITELFREVYADGSWKLVQYFERQILELNLPAKDGTPLVTSGLIGYSAYAPPDARAPVTPFTSDAAHQYFPQTQHSLNNGFKAYWQAHGGLPAFGYPITEEFSGTTPAGRRYVAQIFERARLEWWPDRVGQPDEITQGLLVVELMRQAGWM
ncbi:MAG TPA: SH3 domain-containing protein [Thermomicrobiaceae bacterium]|nr:SH3 domain-containing protein [Thermomicrobiaceae bacterium]